MAINDDLYWYKNVLKRTISTTIRFYLSLSIILSPIILIKEANAADQGDWWLQREIKLQEARDGYARRVYGRSARSFVETDPVTAKSRTVTRIAIAETVPTASKVGASMLQRVAFYAKNPGVQMVGVMAVTQLIEAIGWVMEDGAYVKHKTPDGADPNYEYIPINTNGPRFNSQASACSGAPAYFLKLNPTYKDSKATYSAPYCYLTYVNSNGSSGSVGTIGIYKVPRTNPLQPETINLTPSLLGAAMMGEGYNDPVEPDKYNPIANTGAMSQSVADTYQHAGNGVGDDLANEMDNKIKNAPLTPDGQPAPFGDPRYSNPPTESAPNINDRGWTTDGGTADGTTTPVTDPNGNPTGAQSITVKFPVFCEWAFTVCKWYDDWKTTDQWMKEDPEQKDPEKVEFDDDASAGKVTLTGSEVCPQDSVEFTVLGKTYTYQLPYQPVCDALSFFKPAVLAVGAITSAFIVAGINVKGEE